MRPEPSSYWSSTLPPRPPAPAGVSVPSHADIVIVGGGYTGLSAALHLARGGASVVVLEREHVGWGASSRNGGQVLTGLKPGPAALLARFGPSRAREMFQASLDAIAHLERIVAEENIACGFRRSGHIQAAARPRHFDDLRDERDLLRRHFDHTVRLVMRAEQAAELGTSWFHGLLIDERSGCLNPAQYVNGLASAARGAGARIAEHTAVSSIAPLAPGFTVTTSAGQIACRDILIATNGYTDAAFADLQRRVVPVGSFIIATDPLPPDLGRRLFPTGRVVFDTKHFLHYFRLSDDGRVVFGGRAQFRTSTSETTRTSARILQRELVAIFPELAGIRVAYAWSGNVCFAPGMLPRAGRLNGMHYALAYAGHGVAMATYMGRLIAQTMRGQPAINPFRDLPFRAIPFYRGRPWFLPLAGAYYRVRDWIE